MPSALTAAHLRKLADELDGEDSAAAAAELQAKVDRLEASLAKGGLTDEQQSVLTRAQALLDQLDEEDRAAGGADGANGGAGGSGEGTSDPPEPTPPPARRTRPGRKSGAAYDWTVDGDGKVVKTDVATVYSGADEPDEVELAE